MKGYLILILKSKEMEKKIMKVQNIIRSLTVSFGLVMAIMLFGVGSAFAAVNLPNVIIPAGGARNSASFNVTDTGLLTVRVKIKNTAWFGIGGQSRYRAQLMRGNTEVDRAERVVASDFETVTLSVNIASCNQKAAITFASRTFRATTRSKAKRNFQLLTRRVLNRLPATCQCSASFKAIRSRAIFLTRLSLSATAED